MCPVPSRTPRSRCGLTKHTGPRHTYYNRKLTLPHPGVGICCMLSHCCYPRVSHNFNVSRDHQGRTSRTSITNLRLYPPGGCYIYLTSAKVKGRWRNPNHVDYTWEVKLRRHEKPWMVYTDRRGWLCLWATANKAARRPYCSL